MKTEGPRPKLGTLLSPILQRLPNQLTYGRRGSSLRTRLVGEWKLPHWYTCRLMVLVDKTRLHKNMSG